VHRPSIHSRVSAAFLLPNNPTGRPPSTTTSHAQTALLKASQHAALAASMQTARPTSTTSCSTAPNLPSHPRRSHWNMSMFRWKHLKWSQHVKGPAHTQGSPRGCNGTHAQHDPHTNHPP
jgi:hypothetical protein